MNGVLIDSDIVIELLRDRNPAIRESFEKLLASGTSVFYSPVTVAEIERGARPNERDSIDGLFVFMTCIPVTRDVGARAGNILRRFRASHNVALGDALIAATAIEHDLLLWARKQALSRSENSVLRGVVNRALIAT
jgi:predicted nucleic acid-binding protein